MRNVIAAARAAGMAGDQIGYFVDSGYAPLPRQLAFHVACRQADVSTGPEEVAFGGARGPGKSHASFAQVVLDDARRQPGLKALYLRRKGKKAREQMDDLRRVVLKGIPHKFNKQTQTLTIWQDSRIVIGHFRTESDIDDYLGLEYTVILIEEATQLSASKHQALLDSNRAVRAGLRPRIYLTTNPGGIGHSWFRTLFVLPEAARAGTGDGDPSATTRFIPARVEDNPLLDVSYREKLERNTGWRLAAYRYGDWDIPAGDFFDGFGEAHVADFIVEPVERWMLCYDHGYSHPAAWLLLGEHADKTITVVDEHVQNRQLPPQQVEAVRAMLARHGVDDAILRSVPAGHDCFHERTDRTIAAQYMELGVKLQAAPNDRIQGASAVLEWLGNPAEGIAPRLRIMRRCARLLECLPALQHDPVKADAPKSMPADDTGAGGDDSYDALRYGLLYGFRGSESYVSRPPKDALAAADEADF